MNRNSEKPNASLTSAVKSIVRDLRSKRKPADSYSKIKSATSESKLLPTIQRRLQRNKRLRRGDSRMPKDWSNSVVDNRLRQMIPYVWL